MPARAGDRPQLSESTVDELACQFLKSTYADSTYLDWTLDRRVEGFLRRRGLDRLVYDGDAYDLLMDRVMAHIGRPGSDKESPPTTFSN